MNNETIQKILEVTAGGAHIEHNLVIIEAKVYTTGQLIDRNWAFVSPSDKKRLIAIAKSVMKKRESLLQSQAQ